MTGPLLLGVRHHGPGSARAVRCALEAAEPRVLLVEGPPEADAVVGLAAHEEMRPPVALLAHAGGSGSRGNGRERSLAAFWPLAGFSPEWVAIRWALARGVPVRFIDLPAANSLALAAEQASGASAAADPEEFTSDPLAALAEAAGHEDAERWWEDAVEHLDGPETDQPLRLFAELEEAMAALRADAGRVAQRDALREAHMRLRIREARREFAPERTAVVCGAWHVPALRERATATADRSLLKGLPKVKAEVTWVPWTHRRLTRRSGYGAGISSPGWYAHLHAVPDRPVERWLTRVAALLREEDVGAVSPAHVIEAVRLAQALAALRGRPLAGLDETTEAVRSVLCGGSDVPLALVHDRLTVGDVLGEVPQGAPAVPLQRDLERSQRTLRLKPSPESREHEFDLRRETDAERSRLLHRLGLLGIEWGRPRTPRAGTGTFRESWVLRWEPELSVRTAEAGMWGTTVREAAEARASARAAEADGLAELTELAERVLRAALPGALPRVTRALADRAALESEVGRLASALPALVRTVRYGDVRGSDPASLAAVAYAVADRVRTGLPSACSGLDAEGAAQLRTHLDAAHRAVHLLDQPSVEAAPPTALRHGAEQPQAPAAESQAPAGELLARWRSMLRLLGERPSVPGLLRGRCSRLLLDDGELSAAGAARHLGLGLSPTEEPTEAAAWAEGFLSGGGLLLAHDERLLALFDDWLTALGPDAFTAVLPVLRRAFAEFEPGVRRTLGELVRRGPGGTPSPETTTADGLPGFADTLDTTRADAALETLRLLLAAPVPSEEANR
ncbi:DUF5682 family protein [Streptomyces xiaopingdaonensis]|uniref:DUF5682 family protein n=1 Tax=Streptomyces xiaopingdaonensis TaxID=1565415 RepID=UPI0002F8867C|nr:DUF5682 family protein [Streptomyces xiaopingdaonensis]